MGAGGARLSPINAPHLVLLVGVGVGSSFSTDQFGFAAPQRGHTESVWKRMGKKEQHRWQASGKRWTPQVSKRRSIVVPVYGVRPGRGCLLQGGHCLVPPLRRGRLGWAGCCGVGAELHRQGGAW